MKRRVLTSLLATVMAFTMTMTVNVFAGVGEYTDLELPLVIRTVTYLRGTGGNSRPIRITTDGLLQRWPAGRGVTEWETLASNVRSVVRNSTGGLLYIKDDNTLWGFGPNSRGQLGDGIGLDRSYNEPHLILENVANVSTGYHAFYAVLMDGTLMTWGNGNFYPIHIADNVVLVFGEAGFGNTRFQKSNGGIYNFSRVSGNVTRRIPQPVRYLRGLGATSYLINYEHTLIRRHVRITGAVDYEVIATNVASVFNHHGGSSNIHFITLDGVLWGMGDNNRGQLGDGTVVPRREPVQIAENVVRARPYSFLKQDGTYWTWSRSNPTPQQVAENIATAVGELWAGHFIHRYDNSVIFDVGTQNESVLNNVRVPSVYTLPLSNNNSNNAVNIPAETLPTEVPQPVQPPTAGRVELTAERANELNSFFLTFAGSNHAGIALGDYDIAGGTQSIDTALMFTLLYGINVQGRGGIIEWPDYDMADGDVTREMVSANHIDRLMLQFFGIQNVQHRNIGAFEFNSNNGRYSTIAINGGAFETATNVIDFYDNGNGTFSARIEVTRHFEGALSGRFYNIAVVQPVGDSFILLYWRTQVERDEPMSIRQPSGGITVT